MNAYEMKQLKYFIYGEIKNETINRYLPDSRQIVLL